MLINTSRLINCPILSLHIGGRVATVTEVIIDPDSLKVIACRVEGPLVGKEVGDILPMTSVREFSRLGMIIDSTDELVEADEIVRIRDVLTLNFNLVGLKVETKKGIKLGKVADSTISPNDWQIQQLIVRSSNLLSTQNLRFLVVKSSKLTIIK
jgi:sporulation protein YlmC with PRC-barrel domain